MPFLISDPRDEVLPLTGDFYSISEEETAFFNSLTGLVNDDVLKSHILAIQEESYNVYPYPCIRRFDFLRLKISKHPVYTRFLASAQDPDTIFLDMGCCFGNDIRKVVSDGYPMARIVGSDLRREFWDLGYKLFRQSYDQLPVSFLCGDVFDNDFLDLRSPLSGPTEPPVLLSHLHSLSQLKGCATAIHAAALFHLFNEEQQTDLAHRLAALLSKRQGSMIFGSHIARPVKGLRVEAAGLGSIGAYMFCHSDVSWIDLWNGVVFPRGTVTVDARLEEMSRDDLRRKEGVTNYQLIWCITRL